MGGIVSTMLGGNKDKAIEIKTIVPWKREVPGGGRGHP